MAALPDGNRGQGDALSVQGAYNVESAFLLHSIVSIGDRDDMANGAVTGANVSRRCYQRIKC